MQQSGSLTISSLTKSTEVPVKDAEGFVYRWETSLIVQGEKIEIGKLGPQDIGALQMAVTPAPKRALQAHVEMLAQIKPMGKSDLKQTARISYLVYDLHEANVSEYVLNEICAEYRRSRETTFFPDHGDFLYACERRMFRYADALDQVYNPRPKEPERPIPRAAQAPRPERKKEIWEDTKGKDWTDEQFRAFVDHHRGWDMEFLKFMLNIHDLTAEEYQNRLIAISETAGV